MATATAAADPSGGNDRQIFVFFPMIVGVIRTPAREGEENSQPSDQLVLLNPLLFGGLPDLFGMREILNPDRIPEGPPPASKASVESLTTVDRTEGNGESEECSVCLDRLWNSDAEEEEKCEVVKRMPCGHKFHGGCIEKWLNVHGVCPLCRYRMPEEKEGGKKLREAVERRGDSDGTIQASITFNWSIDLDSMLPPPRQQFPLIEDLD